MPPPSRASSESRAPVVAVAWSWTWIDEAWVRRFVEASVADNPACFSRDAAKTAPTASRALETLHQASVIRLERRLLADRDGLRASRCSRKRR